MNYPKFDTPADDSRVNLDDLIQTLNVEKDQIGDPDAGFQEPVPMPGVKKILTPEEEAKISRETAMAAGEQIATLVDNGSRTLCGFIGGQKDDKYRMSAGQRRDLSESYTRMAMHYGFSGANPLVESLLLTVIILGPKFREAFSDRKMKRIIEEQERQALEQEKMRADIQKLQSMAEIQKLNQEVNGQPGS